MTLRYCGNRGNRNTSGKILEHHMQNVCWKLKFQQQILKYLNVLQWDRKKLWRRSCPYCFPGTTVKCAASSKIPKSSNMRNVSKYVSHKNLQNHNCWSEVAGPIHRGVEKPQKPPNLQPHLCAFGQILKKITFLQHVRVLLLSFKANLQVKCSQDHQMTWNPIIVLRQN